MSRLGFLILSHSLLNLSVVPKYLVTLSAAISFLFFPCPWNLDFYRFIKNNSARKYNYRITAPRETTEF